MQQLEEILRQPLRHELCHDGQKVRSVIVSITPALLTLQRLHTDSCLVVSYFENCPASIHDLEV